MVDEHQLGMLVKQFFFKYKCRSEFLQFFNRHPSYAFCQFVKYCLFVVFESFCTSLAFVRDKKKNVKMLFNPPEYFRTVEHLSKSQPVRTCHTLSTGPTKFVPRTPCLPEIERLTNYLMIMIQKRERDEKLI